MDQTLATEIMHAGHNVLLTGPAGCGKTHTLNAFIREAKQTGKRVSVTATTGLAATHLGGNTIHAWSGIGIHNQLPGNFFSSLSKSRADIINKTDVLVIDEISMLHDYRLDMIEEVARHVRGNAKPFGGLQVILCGDFFQLPPVSRAGEPASQFVVASEAWQNLEPIVCYLNEQHRQNDDKFLEILSAIRSGDVRRHHAEMLLERVDGELAQNSKVTQLHTTNVDVDTINARQLQQLDEQPKHYTMTLTGSKNYQESLKRSCLAQEKLALKKGALVMCIKNNQEKKYVNGSLGTVIDFANDTGYPVVELKNGRTITIEPDTWELRDGDKKRASISQIPLRLAWAVTVHKSQGMTLDAARINLKRAFVEGMGYVALSRVKSLSSLQLEGLNQMALMVSQEALAIDNQLREQSGVATTELAHLRANAKTRKATQKSAPKAGTWTEKLATMRQKYPNAYRPWQDKDDKALSALFSKGKPVHIAKLTKKFGRHPGSIRARLVKLFGEDAVLKTNSKK